MLTTGSGGEGTTGRFALDLEEDERSVGWRASFESCILSGSKRWAGTAVRAVLISALVIFMYLAIFETDRLIPDAAANEASRALGSSAGVVSHSRSVDVEPTSASSESASKSEIKTEDSPLPASLIEPVGLILQNDPTDPVLLMAGRSPLSSGSGSGDDRLSFGSFAQRFWRAESDTFQHSVLTALTHFIALSSAPDDESPSKREAIERKPARHDQFGGVDFGDNARCSTPNLYFDPVKSAFWVDAANGAVSAMDSGDSGAAQCKLCSPDCSIIRSRCRRVCGGSDSRACALCKRLTMHAYTRADISIDQITPHTGSAFQEQRYTWVVSDHQIEQSADDELNAAAAKDTAERARLQRLLTLAQALERAALADEIDRSSSDEDGRSTILQPLNTVVRTLFTAPDQLSSLFPAQPIYNPPSKHIDQSDRLLVQSVHDSQQLLDTIKKWVVRELKSDEAASDEIITVDVDAVAGGGGGAGFDLDCTQSSAGEGDLLLSAGGGGGGGVSAWAAATKSSSSDGVESQSQLVTGGGGGAGLQIVNRESLVHAMNELAATPASGVSGPHNKYDWKKWTSAGGDSANSGATASDSEFDVWVGGGGGGGVLIDRDGTIRTEGGATPDQQNHIPSRNEFRTLYTQFDRTARSCQRTNRLRLFGGGGRGEGMRLIVSYRGAPSPAPVGPERERAPTAPDGTPSPPLVGRVIRRYIVTATAALSVAFSVDFDDQHKPSSLQHSTGSHLARYQRFLTRFGGSETAAAAETLQRSIDAQRMQFTTGKQKASTACAADRCIPVRAQRREPQPKPPSKSQAQTSESILLAARDDKLSNCERHPVLESRSNQFGHYYGNALCPLRNTLTQDALLNRFCCQFDHKISEMIHHHTINTK